MHLPNWRRLPDANRRTFVLLALAWLAGLMAYGNGILGVFQFDDYNVIVDTPRVHTLAAWWQATSHGGLRPLLNLSYTLNWLSGDGSPVVFHAFNLLVHLVATACVYALVRSFLRRRVDSIDIDLTAAWAALLFAVHPMHSEAITYISGRSTALMTVFYLGALVYYARSDEGRLRHRFASLGLFVLAVLTKETALLFPLALLVWDWAAGTPWRTALRRQWPYWLICLLLLLAVLQHPGYWSLLEQSIATRDPSRDLPTQLHSSAVLLGKLFWPAGLNIDPDWPVLDGIAQALPELALFAAALLLAVHWRRDRPWLALAFVWLLIHLLLPNLFFPRADIANERQVFWADWAIFLAVAVEIQRHLKPALASVVVLVCAVLLCGSTIGRNGLYQSELALWQDTARHSPHKARVFNNLGYALASAGRTDEARAAYRRALELDPLHLKAANNLQRLDR